jgi:hypothetical protein
VTGAAQFLLFPLALAPVCAALVIRHEGSTEGFLIAMALVAAGGALLYLAVLERSARYAEASREVLLGSLLQDEGPIAAE